MKEVNEEIETQILKKKLKDVVPKLCILRLSELENYLKERGYSYTMGFYGKKACYHCRQSNYEIQPHDDWIYKIIIIKV